MATTSVAPLAQFRGQSPSLRIPSHLPDGGLVRPPALSAYGSHTLRLADTVRASPANLRARSGATEATDTSLVRRPSAAGVVTLARDEARVVRGQKVHYRCHLLGSSHPSHRDLARHVLYG